MLFQLPILFSVPVIGMGCTTAMLIYFLQYHISRSGPAAYRAGWSRTRTGTALFYYSTVQRANRIYILYIIVLAPPERHKKDVANKGKESSPPGRDSCLPSLGDVLFPEQFPNTRAK